MLPTPDCEQAMEFKDFLKQRRTELKLSQSDVAEQLSEKGQETGNARISHWETGRNKPPLEDAAFRKALASVLEIDVHTMLEKLGYVVEDDGRTIEAKMAADIVDQLSPEGRQLAIELLRSLEKRFV